MRQPNPWMNGEPRLLAGSPHRGPDCEFSAETLTIDGRVEGTIEVEITT